MDIVVDGVFFQLAKSGIARVWRSVLPELARRPDTTLTLLDRGGCPDLPGVRRLQFPSYSSKYNAADSALLEQFCRHLGADLFLSTYYTTPLATPSVALVYDMIPERLGFELGWRDWQEKELCLAHARRHVCISGQTRADLLEFYPELDPAQVAVAHCGVDPAVFQPAGSAAQAEIRRRLQLTRPYFMAVGSRAQHNDYKNVRLLFAALAAGAAPGCDVLCVGGEPELQDWVAELAPDGCRVQRAELTDAELAAAYGGAEALVYPSLYEGFGMPVIEAMACNCPVITTALGSLQEIAGAAALLVDGASVPQMADALRDVRRPDVSRTLRQAGLAHAARFRWAGMADTLHAALRDTAAEAASGKFTDFYRSWTEIRRLQGAVDVLS